ncbi:MAG: hypothetical protein KIS95_05000 [Anaerolineae bacterium]|uniref:hypothetical protein n=1 Tax=Promineifilum sp. TaxID=2664178 RepID=UPI001DA6F7DB|nr:hypothetical protein [Anaerolineales bacterium]MCB8935330.1 hypothetical protein [Promineifilum sp.]MCO5180391.1 hypothetical protein [Promineifilum sp.]MCW5846564.1 hypothetical protein [Anaerolineae bacterium]
MRGLVSPKGEQFGYVVGGVLYTMDDEPSGRLEKDFIVDLAGNIVWRVVGDGVYALNGMETIGYLTGERADDRE